MSETLSLRALLERSSIRPGKATELHLLVDVKAIGAPVDSARPALSVVFVIDASGSMSGHPLEQVIASVGMLTDLLAPEDKVGVVSFSDDATEVCALAALTSEQKRVVKRRVQAMRSLQSTNIEAGLRKAQAMLGARTAHERQVILLLSDGAPNVGASSAAALAEIAAGMRADANVSTLGYGANHNSDVLAAVAEAGGGQYWFIPDPQQASVEFARAVGAQGDVVADGLELVVVPGDNTEVKDILGTSKPKFTKLGPSIALPDLRQHQSRLVVAELVVKAPDEPGPLVVGDVIVRYRAAGSTEVKELRPTLKIDVVDKEPQLVVEVHQAAMMARAEIVRVQARDAADRGSFDQAAAMLRAMIKQLAAVPGYVQADGSPLSECAEQLIDEANEYEQRPSAERLMAFKASQRAVEVSQGAKNVTAMAASSSKSAKLMLDTLGPAVNGCIVVTDKSGVERRFPILPEMTVGRSPDNEIPVQSSMLSRKHTRFVCRGGALLVVDLCSTNGTFLNGQRVAAPRVLKPGDKVYVGDATFTFELDDPSKPPTA